LGYGLRMVKAAVLDGAPDPHTCYYHIRQLGCIRLYLDSTTACTIATSIVHSKLDYCNSLYYNLPKSQITRLQQIQNSLARAVVKTPKSCHITPVLRCLHWLKINERIEYKLLSLTYKVLTTSISRVLCTKVLSQEIRNFQETSFCVLQVLLHHFTNTLWQLYIEFYTIRLVFESSFQLRIFKVANLKKVWQFWQKCVDRTFVHVKHGTV